LENESIYKNYYHNYTIGNKTFERDRKDIYDIFGIVIEYDPSAKVYYLDDDRFEKPVIYIHEIHRHCFGVSMAKDY